MNIFGGHHVVARPRRAAFTLAETVMSLVVVSVMFVAALSTVGASKLSQQKASLSSRGQLLAEMLMSEILLQNYKDPGPSPVFGIEPSESTTTRADFDDVDDYNGWSSSPPTYKDGTQIVGFTGWRQSVTVNWVDPMNPAQVAYSDTNAKRITVEIFYGNMRTASLVAVKTASGY